MDMQTQTMFEIDNGGDLSGFFPTLEAAQSALRDEARYSDCVLSVANLVVLADGKKIGRVIVTKTSPGTLCAIRGCASDATWDDTCLFHRSR